MSWCKACVASTAILWVVLIFTYAERISKYGVAWIWQPFVQ